MSKIIKKAVVSDYRDSIAGKSSNGGCYGYWTVYRLFHEDELRAGLETRPQYEVEYGTIADFDCCKYCGKIGSCICDRIPQIITEERVLKALSEAEEHPSGDVHGEILEYVEV